MPVRCLLPGVGGFPTLRQATRTTSGRVQRAYSKPLPLMQTLSHAAVQQAAHPHFTAYPRRR